MGSRHRQKSRLGTRLPVKEERFILAVVVEQKEAMETFFKYDVLPRTSLRHGTKEGVEVEGTKAKSWRCLFCVSLVSGLLFNFLCWLLRSKKKRKF